MSRTPAKRYTLEEIETGLRLLALNAGSYTKTADQLTQAGQPVSKQVLWEWANERHIDRYHEIRTETHSAVADRVASQAEQIMLEAGNLELDLLARLRNEAPNLPPKELATALRNVTTTKALNNDKISAPIRGRPTAIVENRDATQILHELQRLGVVEGTAEET